MQELETEKTVLVKGVHWTRFLPASLILSASVALMLLKTRPPGLLAAGLPFIISRHIAIRIMKTLNPDDYELSVIKAQDICETTDLT